MIFEATPLEGLLLVKPEKRHDERGYFSRLWCDHGRPAAGFRDSVQVVRREP